MFVKICGITNEEDALLAVAMGAHAVGFVFAPSTRQIAPQVAADIIKRLPPEIMAVGVFRDWAPQRVSDIANQVGLGAVQLHGHEPPEVAKWLKGRVAVVIQAFAAGDDRVGRASEYGVDAVLLDSPNPGSAQVFDWSLASEVPQGQRVIIAGGLNPDNVRQAIVQTHCWGVDVASGVERAPGYKDPIKLREFIRAAMAGFDDLDDHEAEMGERSDDRDGGDGSFYDWQEEV